MERNEEKKRYLRRYLESKREEIFILEKIEELQSQQTSVCVNSDGMPKGNVHSDLSVYAAAMDELVRELAAQREMTGIVYQEIKSAIKKMDNPVYKKVLERRYIGLQRWEKIAAEMGYSYRHIINIHGYALENFNI